MSKVMHYMGPTVPIQIFSIYFFGHICSTYMFQIFKQILDKK